MKRREQRECIFQLLFRVEFNRQEEMPEQADLYLDDIREEQTVKEKDEAYILEKIQQDRGGTAEDRRHAG